MRWKDLIWLLAYPIYQVIGTLRHESAHALAALAYGGVIEEFVIIPSKDYWGYVRWEGTANLFTTGAPYLLDLFTFLVFFGLCMQVRFHRRWIWLNLVIIGVLSPLINSAYNYLPNRSRINDVDILLRDGNASMVHTYFILTLVLYSLGLFVLFTRARMHNRQPTVNRAWTVVPLAIGIITLVSACAITFDSSVETGEQLVMETQTPEANPSPIVRSATMTPTQDPSLDYYKVHEQVVAMLNTDFTARGPENDLQWSSDIDYMENADGQILVDAYFISGDWKIRIFDWNFKDRADAMDVSVVNKPKRFVWRGYAGNGDLSGWLTSGGLVPEISNDGRSDQWLTYTNNRYGYRFRYPPEADVFELGVSTFDLNDVPADMTQDEYRDHLYETIGHNVCVHLELGDGYILFEAPENWEGNYTFCRKLGPGAPGWSAPVRTETVTVEGQDYLIEGREFIKIDGTGDDHDEALAFKLPSGLRIEFGAYSSADGSYDLYRADVLPVLIDILETFETIPRRSEP